MPTLIKKQRAEPFQRSDRFLLLFAIGGFLFILDGLLGLFHRPWLLLFSSLGITAILTGLFFLRQSHWIAISGLLLSSTAIGFALTEILLRMFFVEPALPEGPKGFERLITSTWPHPVHPTKQGIVYRILGVSDSFGVMGDEHNYHWILEEILKKRGIPAEMINFSACGYSPGEEIELVSRFAPPYQPNLFLHGLYLGNDLQSSIVNADRVFVFGVPLLRFTGPSLIRPWFHLSFRLLRWFARNVPNELMRLHERLSGLPNTTFSGAQFFEIELGNLMTCKRDAPFMMNWEKTLNQIHQMQDLAHSLGAEYVMVLLPDQCQVNPAMLDQVVKRFGLDPADYDLDLPQVYLKEDCKHRGIPCLDLTSAFREQSSTGVLYNWHDTHWNEAGNQLAAEQISTFLLSAGLAQIPK